MTARHRRDLPHPARSALLALTLLAGCIARPRGTPEAPRASAAIHDASGAAVGTVRFERSDMGVRIRGSLQGLPPGTHGMHFHDSGACSPPAFTTAGGHFNPGGRKHGLESPDGTHAGDLPNLDVNADGRAELDLVDRRVTLGDSTDTDLLEGDGTALVIHADRDDQRTDPSGNSGARIACGFIIRGE